MYTYVCAGATCFTTSPLTCIHAGQIPGDFGRQKHEQQQAKKGITVNRTPDLCHLWVVSCKLPMLGARQLWVLTAGLEFVITRGQSSWHRDHFQKGATMGVAKVLGRDGDTLKVHCFQADP